jgi:hypothetical protein
MRSAGILVGLFMVLGAAACAPGAQATRVTSATPHTEASDAALVTTTTFAAAVPASHVEHVEEAKPDAAPLPTSCEGESTIKDAKLCVVPAAFTKKLCSGIYPEVALSMFAKDAAWTRLWLAGDVEAWNASGGRTHRTQLAFDEEVVVLAKHGAAQTGGIVMTGAMASYDVLRFDGTCVSVMEGELTTRRPPKPKPAKVPWSRLEESTRHALLASAKVKATRDAFEKACNVGDKKTCDKAERSFTQAILEQVRSGTLPEPSRRP